MYDTGVGTAKAAYSALTTNPVTTAGNIERGVATMIDGAIAAEDTPAQVQVARAIAAAKNASARDIGHAVGATAANVALAVAPGAAAAKVSALRSLRAARPRMVYDPPSVIWVKENLGPDSAAKRYNDAATGARPGMAPALRGTTPGARPVKFDGIDGDYLIDRKTGIRWTKKFKDQALKQSRALAEGRHIAVWEFPTKKTQIDAMKLLESLGIKNIKTRVAKS